MLYIKNNLKYAMTFTVDVNGRTKKFDFDCRRIYRDTGNVATTGVTPISEDDYELLYGQNAVFKKHIDTALLSKVKESGATTMANKMDELEKENEILKEQLAKAVKENSSGEKEETAEEPSDEEDTAEEPSDGSLKEELENLSKGKKNKGNKPKTNTEVDEKESF